MCVKTNLSPDVVDKAVHARFHAEAVLAWQQLRISVAIQTDAARQQRFKLLHIFLVLHVPDEEK